MRRFLVSVLAVLLNAISRAEAPVYSTASIVNAADNQAGTLAPNTLATIYGQNLTFGIQSLTAKEVQGGTLPTIFP
jgi:hypothetical protein